MWSLYKMADLGLGKAALFVYTECAGDAVNREFLLCFWIYK